MNLVKSYPSVERLRELFEYCPESGQLIWKLDRGPSAKAGSVAGFLRADNGVWSVTVDGSMYAAHTLVWKLAMGEDPPGLLRHINGQKDDNRLENLAPLKGSNAITSIEDIMSRCEIIGECWHWQGTKSDGTPVFRLGDQVVNVRRHLFTEILGLPAQSKRFITMSCAHLDCVAPAHLRQYTRKQLQTASAKRTKYGDNKARNAKIALAKRAKSPYSDEFVAEVRAMEGTSKGIARELGISFSTVNAWRTGKTRNAVNGPWAGLLAA